MGILFECQCDERHNICVRGTACVRSYVHVMEPVEFITHRAIPEYPLYIIVYTYIIMSPAKRQPCKGSSHKFAKP